MQIAELKGCLTCHMLGQASIQGTRLHSGQLQMSWHKGPWVLSPQLRPFPAQSETATHLQVLDQLLSIAAVPKSSPWGLCRQPGLLSGGAQQGDHLCGHGAHHHPLAALLQCLEAAEGACTACRGSG